VANCELANRDEGEAQSPLCRCPCTHRRRTTQRIRDKGQQHLPGDEAWLIGEHRASGEKKYYLANLPAATGLRTLAATIKARWICEQAHQQLKEELGLEWDLSTRRYGPRGCVGCGPRGEKIKWTDVST
jgi:hypothetical protein